MTSAPEFPAGDKFWDKNEGLSTPHSHEQESYMGEHPSLTTAFFVVVVLGTEPRTSHMLGNHSQLS